MTYHCCNCGETLTIPSSAAWPQRCPYCGAAPLAMRLGVLRSTPALSNTGAAGAGVLAIAPLELRLGSAALADELLDRARLTAQ